MRTPVQHLALLVTFSAAHASQVVPSGDKFYCEFDQKYCDKAEHRYILSVRLADASAEAWVSVFNDQVGHEAGGPAAVVCCGLLLRAANACCCCGQHELPADV